MVALLFSPSVVATNYAAECLSVSAPSLVYHGQMFTVNATFNNTGTKSLNEGSYYLYNGASSLFSWYGGNYFYPEQSVASGSQASYLVSMYSRGTIPGGRELLVSLKRSNLAVLLATCDASLQVVGFVNATVNPFSAQPYAQLSDTNPERYPYTLTLPFYNNGYSPWQQDKFAVYINASESIFSYSGIYSNSVNLGMASGDNYTTWSTKTFSMGVYAPVKSSAYTLKVSARMRNLTGNTLFGAQGDISISIPAATPTPSPSPSPSPSPIPSPSPSPSPFPSPLPSPIPSVSVTPTDTATVTPTPTPTPAAYYWVNGTVVDPSGAAPYPAVPNASVYIRNASVSYFIFANSSGRFGLYLYSGSYVLNANATGYYTGNYVDVAVSSQNVSLTLFANHSSSYNTGSIYGKAADYYSNATIDGVNVTLFLRSNDSGALNYLSHSLTTLGYYSFNELAGGNYSLTATHPSYYSADNAVTVLSSQAPADFRLKPLPYLFGFVTDSYGNGIADAFVNATPTNSNFGPVVNTTNSSGGYRFDSLGSSNYTLRVSKDGYVSKSAYDVPAPTSEGVRTDFSMVATATPMPTVVATVAPAPTVSVTSTPAPTASDSVPFSQFKCPDFSANQSLYSECIKSFGEYIMLKDASGCTYNAICKPNATSASVPSPTQNGIYTFPLSASTEQVPPAEVLSINYSTSPLVINLSRMTNLSGIVNASKAVKNFSCSGPSGCVCKLEKIRVNGKLQDNQFFPDATGNYGNYSYNVSCKFMPPVNGNYSIFAYDNAQEVPTNTIGILLTPGQLPVVYVIAPQSGSMPAIVVIASVVIALGMLAFAAFALFDFMFRDARKAAALEAQKEQIIEDIKMVKYRFMKRQIDEATFRRTMSEKEKEYTLIVSQLKTLKKDLKDAEQ